ncbi:MAG TPA: hypothetical protein ENI56_00565 [Candidatus Kaiserbacteria bacterium]|nr:hypothetical protein [Candidatus Kaiserbacteria bacterium]
MTEKTETAYQKYNLEKESAQKVFDRFDLGAIEKISQFEQGMINDVYSINGKYVLKINSAHPNLPKLSNEAAVYEALADSSVPVPKLYGYDENRKLLGYPYILMEQIQGETLKEIWRNLNDEQRMISALETGKILGTIHNSKPEQVRIASADFEPNLKSSIHSRIGEIGTMLRSSNVLDEHVIKKIETYFQESSCFDVEIQPSLLHGNYVFANIIAEGGTIRGIIDWEWVSFGHDEEELAVTLYRGPTGIVGGMDEKLLASFKDGYLSAHQISDTFNERYLSYALLYFLKILPNTPAWTHRPDKQKEYIDATNNLINQIIL